VAEFGAATLTRLPLLRSGLGHAVVPERHGR